MGSLSPLQVALFIVGGLSVVGLTIALVRSRMTYSGYREYVDEVRRLGLAMRAEIFRDGSDVVVSGTYEGLPAVVRFSNAENTPGLNIRMQAPATFVMSVAPAGVPVSEGGRTVVKTGDDLLDTRFATRTDHPTQAKMFMTRQVVSLLEQLACSMNTYLSIGSGTVELSELVIPQGATALHVLDHLTAMAKLSRTLRDMPGSDQVKLVTFERERHVAGRIAMAVGAVAALLAIFAATRVPNQMPVTGVNQTLSSGILPADAYHIPNAKAWRTVVVDDLDPAAVRWLRDSGQQPQGRIQGDFSGKGTGRDVAYLLIAADGSRRIVLLAENENRYDTKFPYIGLAARVPKGMVNSIEWVGGKVPQGLDGDGVLLVRKPDDATSAVVLFLSGHAVVSASPINYQNIKLE